MRGESFDVSLFGRHQSDLSVYFVSFLCFRFVEVLQLTADGHLLQRSGYLLSSWKHRGRSRIHSLWSSTCCFVCLVSQPSSYIRLPPQTYMELKNFDEHPIPDSSLMCQKFSTIVVWSFHLIFDRWYYF